MTIPGGSFPAYKTYDEKGNEIRVDACDARHPQHGFKINRDVATAGANACIFWRGSKTFGFSDDQSNDLFFANYGSNVCNAPDISCYYTRFGAQHVSIDYNQGFRRTLKCFTTSTYKNMLFIGWGGDYYTAYEVKEVIVIGNKRSIGKTWKNVQVFLEYLHQVHK